MSDFLEAKKVSESSSKVINVTPELVWKSPLDVSSGSLYFHLPPGKYGHAVCMCMCMCVVELCHMLLCSEMVP